MASQETRSRSLRCLFLSAVVGISDSYVFRSIRVGTEFSICEAPRAIETNGPHADVPLQFVGRS